MRCRGGAGDPEQASLSEEEGGGGALIKDFEFKVLCISVDRQLCCRREIQSRNPAWTSLKLHLTSGRHWFRKSVSHVFWLPCSCHPSGHPPPYGLTLWVNVCPRLYILYLYILPENVLIFLLWVRKIFSSSWKREYLVQACKSLYRDFRSIIKINQGVSRLSTVTSGCVLSPPLFIIYIDSVAHMPIREGKVMLMNCNSQMTSVLMADIPDNLQQILTPLNQECNANNMRIDIEKQEAIVKIERKQTNRT